MEWVETTAKTVDEAKDQALDRLGVDEHDAEFEILEEPRQGLFGRTRGEARVRARVRPVQPRPKAERRDRRRGRPTKSSKGSASTTNDGETETSDETETPGGAGTSDAANDRTPSGEPRRSAPRRGGRGNTKRADRPAAATSAGSNDEESTMTEDITVEQQAEMVEEFLTGLLDAFGYDATVSSTTIDEETIEVAAEGTDLGLLVGPKGNTLQAIHDLSRTVVQRRASGNHEGRVRLDVAGYREKRRTALEGFTRKVADQVLETGQAQVLEPMSSADRKVVHDTANTIEGVRTTSEGDEPRRRVVLLPDS